MTQQPDTQHDLLDGPLAPGVHTLATAGWVSVDVPASRVPARQPVVLVGPGGILVVGSHKTPDTVLANLAGTVTALLPQSMRGAVLVENGHDLQSLPELARSRSPRLDGADIRAAVIALAGLRSGGGLLLVQEFLERTRNAGSRPAAAEQAAGRVVRIANFVGRHALGLGILVAIIFIALALSTGEKSGSTASSTVGGERTAAAQTFAPGQVAPFGSTIVGR